MNNETIGISTEIAIADFFEVAISDDYRSRGDESIIDMTFPIIGQIFKTNNIPYPYKHIAENQNPVDFILINDETLSVKTNQKNIGMVAPQIVGQPTAETFFTMMFPEFGYDINFELKKNNLIDTYQNRSKLFKQFVFKNIDVLLSIYWKHLFECDYIVYIYNFISRQGLLTNKPQYIVLTKHRCPTFNKAEISFTKKIDAWNVSCTVKYYDVSIGEFEVHRNRNCFKFRFKLKGILELLNEGML